MVNYCLYWKFARIVYYLADMDGYCGCCGSVGSIGPGIILGCSRLLSEIYFVLSVLVCIWL